MVVLSGSHERAVHINISRRAYELSKLAVGKRRDAVAGYHGRQVGNWLVDIDLISSVFPPDRSRAKSLLTNLHSYLRTLPGEVNTRLKFRRNCDVTNNMRFSKVEVKFRN